MNFKKEYRFIILPLIKASPVILLFIVTALLAMHRAINYMVPEYRAKGAIKINNLSNGQAAINLFDNEPSSGGNQSENFRTEVEVFKTKDLIQKTLENLDWELSIFRVGSLRLSEMFEESPFTIDYQLVNEKARDQFWYFAYVDEDHFRLTSEVDQDTTGAVFAVGDTLNLPGVSFSLKKRHDFLENKPFSLNPGDKFAFKVNSMRSLVDHYGGSALFVKPVEKDVSIIEIFFNHEVPEKSQQFVNQLMATYIQEGELGKLRQADETLDYLDKQLEEVGGKLKQAEGDLAHFRTSNQLIDTKQQTDATLRELTQLDMSQLGLRMKTVELERLQNYLLSGSSLSSFSPNFEALQDVIFQENYLKAQALESQQKDLLQLYTRQNEIVANNEEKIRKYRSFLHTTVDETLANLRLKGSEVDRNIEVASQKIKAYPEKERNLVILQRELSLNENMYNYLMQKRTEVAIARSSNMFPHKVIEHADLPRRPVSPNKALLYGLSFLLSLIAGMIFAYVYHYFKEKVSGKEDLEFLGVPLVGFVYRNEPDQKDKYHNVYGLMANLERLPSVNVKNQGKLLVVSSMVPGEGKSFTSTILAEAYAATGKRVLLIDMDVRKPTLHKKYQCENNVGYADVLEGRKYALNAIRKSGEDNLYLLTAGQLTSENFAPLFSRRSIDFIYDYRWHFDIVIVDTPPLGIFEDSLPLMNASTANLFLVRKGFTEYRMLKAINGLFQETKVPNLYLVMNGEKSEAKVSGYKKYLRKYYSMEPSMA